jgi:hypothetical protein
MDALGTYAAGTVPTACDPRHRRVRRGLFPLSQRAEAPDPGDIILVGDIIRPGSATNQTDAGIAIVLLPVPAMPTMLAGNYW